MPVRGSKRQGKQTEENKLKELTSFYLLFTLLRKRYKREENFAEFNVCLFEFNLTKNI